MVLDNANNTITVQSVTGRFLLGEEIQISSSVAGVGTVIEKVKSVTYPTASTAIITLDTGYKQVSLLIHFLVMLLIMVMIIGESKVNTSGLFEDKKEVI